MSLRAEARAEAKRLLDWWAGHLVDVRGGFYGEIDTHDRPVIDAPKSIILNTRLLWFFSAMAREGDDRALILARRAADYIRANFHDAAQGGLYWLLTADGQPEDTRKQAYAQAFAVYAFAEYYQVSGDAAALDFACGLQRLIEVKYWDPECGGYIEALDRDWNPPADQRLSDKDLDAPKTMNTHLHVLEAYSRLHAVAPTDDTRLALHRILTVFLDRFAGLNGHLRLFFDMGWNDLTRSISYGHDVEASWLIWEAAEALGNKALLERARPIVLALVETARCEGMSEAGAFSYEKSFDGHTDPDGEWWGQAEALVGFVNAWQMTGEADWLDAAEKVWAYTKAQYGVGGETEWTWYAASAPRDKIYKAGMWKCPYHNGRAMIELDRRLG